MEPHPTGKRYNPWFFALLACFFLLLLLSTRLLNDFDLGYHLKGGQWILQNHRVPLVDDYTYTVSGHPYLDIHWLYQVCIYLTYLLGGYSLLSILNIALIAAAFFLTLKRLRSTGVSAPASVILFTLLILACEKRFQVRPEIVSWVLLALTLWVLELRTQKGRNLLFLLPCIQVIWANVEGLFPLGWACMGVFTLGGFLAGRLDRKLLAYSVLSVGVCLLNPYLLQGVLFPFNYLATLGTSNAFKQHIAELQSSWNFTTSDYLLFSAWLPLFIYRAFSIGLFGLMAATWRKRAVHEFLLVGAFFYLSATAQRNIPLFMLAAVPVAAACLRDLPWPGLSRNLRSLFFRPQMAWTFTLFILLFCARVATNAYYASDRRLDRVGLGLDADSFPVKAVQFLWDQGLNGRILNQQDPGGWLAWKGPQKEFVDGRLEVMGQDFFKEYLSSFSEGGLTRLADKYQADILLFNPHTASAWVFALKKSPDWRPVYLDGYYAVYLRDHYAPQVPNLDDDRVLAQAGVEKNIVARSGEILQATRPATWKTWMEGFFVPQLFPHDLLDIGLFNFDNGHPQAAEPAFLEAIRRTGGKYFEFYLDTAILYSLDGRKADASKCAMQVLSEQPSNKVALQILSGAGLR